MVVLWPFRLRRPTRRSERSSSSAAAAKRKKEDDDPAVRENYIWGLTCSPPPPSPIFFFFLSFFGLSLWFPFFPSFWWWKIDAAAAHSRTHKAVVSFIFFYGIIDFLTYIYINFGCCCCCFNFLVFHVRLVFCHGVKFLHPNRHTIV